MPKLRPRWNPSSSAPFSPAMPSWSRARSARAWRPSSRRCKAAIGAPHWLQHRKIEPMLYWLASFSDAISSQPIFRYVTFRAVGAMITALALMRLLGPAMLASLCRRRISGTRSAGAIMVAMLLAATLLWAKPINSYVWIAVGVVLAFGAGELVGECWSGRRSALLQDAWIAISATAASLACFAVASQTSTPPPFATPAGSIVDVGWLHVALGAFVIAAAGQIVKTADRAYGSVLGTLLIA